MSSVSRMAAQNSGISSPGNYLDVYDNPVQKQNMREVTEAMNANIVDKRSDLDARESRHPQNGYNVNSNTTLMDIHGNQYFADIDLMDSNANGVGMGVTQSEEDNFNHHSHNGLVSSSYSKDANYTDYGDVPPSTTRSSHTDRTGYQGEFAPDEHSAAIMSDDKTTDRIDQYVTPAMTEADEVSLYQAAVDGHIDAIKTLIRIGEAENVSLLSDRSNDKGRTMLHAAVHGHCTDVLHVLLSHKANVNVQDVDGDTPLHVAVKHGYTDIVELLLSHGANVNIEDEQGRTPLQFCLNIDRHPNPNDAALVNQLLPLTDFSICDFDGVGAMHCLSYWDMWSPLQTALGLSKNANIKDNRGRTLLHYCFMNPHHVCLDGAYILIRCDANIMAKDFDGKTPIHRLMAHPLSSTNHDVSRFMRDFICSDIRNSDGHTLLHISTISGDSEVLRFLHHSAVNMDEADKEGNNPLHIAIQRNQSEVVKTLIRCGANPNAIDLQQQSPLHLAATSSRITAAKMLLCEGADVDQRDERGRTALHRSVHCGSLEMVKLLVNAKCNINALDNDESLPIHFAASEDRLEIVEYLLLKGSKANFSDLEGRSPLHYAVKTGNSDILRILILHGCSVNEYDKYGQTPLHLAAELGKSDAVQTLMNRGANENLRDAEGKKAEQVAVEAGSLRVMKVMKDHRDSMIMYSQENLDETDAIIGQSRTNMACVSVHTLDNIDESEDLPDEVVKHMNGIRNFAQEEKKKTKCFNLNCCKNQ